MARSAVLVAALLVVAIGAARAAPPSADAQANQALFARADEVNTGDHPLFLKVLAQLHQREKQLSPAQRWHLRFLDAWQAGYEGRTAEARTILHDVISHSGDTSLKARSYALLVNVLTRDQHYEEAYSIAHKLIGELPRLKDPSTRIAVLHDYIQMLKDSGQYGLALDYARQMGKAFPSGKGQCIALMFEAQAIMLGGLSKTTNDHPSRKAIDYCKSVDQMVYADSLSLDLAYQMTMEGHPGRAVTFLRRLTPSIRKVAFQPHVAELDAMFAAAYVELGQQSAARKSALAALAASPPRSFPWPRKKAYEVLYRIEENAGNAAAALGFYKKYAVLDKAALDNDRARSLAYQMVKQEVLAKKLKLDALNKQNQILRLRNALEHKAAETGRLYIVLLLCGLGFVGFWLYRLLISHRRLKHIARHDGLTGALNHQHFFGDAATTLARMQRDERSCCLALMDLDHFKRVNDTFGHAAGDEVLRHVTRVCQSELRGCDLFGRLGGEEFGILLTDCEREHAAEIVHRIRTSIVAAPTALANGNAIEVSASFGLACADGDPTSLQQLYANADTALYRAKHGGRNQLVVCGEDTGASSATVSGSPA